MPHKNSSGEPAKPLLLFMLAVGVLAVSSGAIFARMAEEAPAVTRAAWRVTLAALVFAPYVGWTRRDEVARLRAADWGVAALAGAFLAGHFATWIASLDYLPVASSVLLVNTVPIWVALLAPFCSTDRVTRSQLIGIALSFVGCVIIGWNDLMNPAAATDELTTRAPENAPLGVALAIAGAICLAGYILAGRRLRPRVSLQSYVSVCYGAAGVFLWIAALALGLRMIGFAPVTWVGFVGMALVAQSLGHTTYNWALRHLGPALVAVALLGEPIGSGVMAFFIYNESPGLAFYPGSVLILAGILIATLRPETPKPKPQPIVEES